MAHVGDEIRFHPHGLLGNLLGALHVPGQPLPFGHVARGTDQRYRRAGHLVAHEVETRFHPDPAPVLVPHPVGRCRAAARDLAPHKTRGERPHLARVVGMHRVRRPLAQQFLGLETEDVPARGRDVLPVHRQVELGDEVAGGLRHDAVSRLAGPQCLVRQLAVHDVADRSHDAGRRAGRIRDGLEACFDPDPPTVLVPDAAAVTDLDEAPRREAGEDLPQVRRVLRMGGVDRAGADQLLGLVAEQTARAWRDEQPSARQVHVADHVGCVVGEKTVAGLALKSRQRRFAELGHVHDGAKDRDDDSRRVRLTEAAREHVAHVAVRPDEPGPHLEIAPPPQGGVEVAHDKGAVVGVVGFHRRSDRGREARGIERVNAEGLFRPGQHVVEHIVAPVSDLRDLLGAAQKAVRGLELVSHGLTVVDVAEARNDLARGVAPAVPHEAEIHVHPPPVPGCMLDPVHAPGALAAAVPQIVDQGADARVILRVDTLDRAGADELLGRVTQHFAEDASVSDRKRDSLSASAASASRRAVTSRDDSSTRPSSVRRITVSSQT